MIIFNVSKILDYFVVEIVIFKFGHYCRTINEIAHYLDQQRNRIRFSTDLFSNVLESQRARLCSYIEKLMFIAPVEYGRKCEEILWRKCFYDVYTLLKRFKKVNIINSNLFNIKINHIIWKCLILILARIMDT